ncbi:hypothetical protein [Pseudomonas monsensis]|uniref:hypothetical protein n=1 Tax=Pseudomonas monsensis TaxID=2745509 RepID=UPI002ABB3B5E|nr:hypothetical protein [Pseudomonas monsensis]MDZ3826347.1 hypothetical protein [Pseudomonas monsensis]
MSEPATVVVAGGVGLAATYRRFGDATRESEVVQRNRLRHPGFVPARPIKIAQR